MNLSAYPAKLQPVLERAAADVAALMDALAAGAIDVETWRDAFARSIARNALAAYMTGAGTSEIDDTALVMIREWVDEQLKYLDGFALAIESSPEFLPKWNARAEMYAAAPATLYWEGLTAGLPLPAQPGQGTQCLSNCRCAWRIEWIDKEAGDADAYWEISATEHCQTCLERRRLWYPVRIRGGVLQL